MDCVRIWYGSMAQYNNDGDMLTDKVVHFVKIKIKVAEF